MNREEVALWLFPKKAMMSIELSEITRLEYTVPDGLTYVKEIVKSIEEQL